MLYSVVCGSCQTVEVGPKRTEISASFSQATYVTRSLGGFFRQSRLAAVLKQYRRTDIKILRGCLDDTKRFAAACGDGDESVRNRSGKQHRPNGKGEKGEIGGSSKIVCGDLGWVGSARRRAEGLGLVSAKLPVNRSFNPQNR